MRHQTYQERSITRKRSRNLRTKYNTSDLCSYPNALVNFCGMRIM